MGKTMLARVLGRLHRREVSRIQCTPGLRFVSGPIFANVVLVDELNRATPHTQAAFLEPLDEGQVTVDGGTHLLPQPFFLLATLNPAQHHGTYPLPEGQLDRFMLAVPVLAHRMLVRPEAGPAAGIIRILLEEVAVPPSLDAGRARP